MTPLLETPLTAWHVANGAKMAPFAGWNMPIQYPTGIIAEHLHTRSQAGLFDICHMGQFIVSGKNAAEGLAGTVTINIATLKPGRCRYGFLLNPAGGIIDDLIVYRLREDRFMVVVNAGCRATDYAAFFERLGNDVTLEDVSDATAKIDLQGPEAFAVLESVLPGPWRRLPYFAFNDQESFDGTSLLISRTGYTGELGVEIYCPSEKVEKLWTLLLMDERVKPVGLGARDTLRLEVGLPLNGQDLDEQHNPAEAGYGAMLTSQSAYVGKDGALEIRQKLTPLQLEGRRSARHGDAVYKDGQQVGVVTSASFAPSVGSAIAFAYIAADHAGGEEYVLQAAKTELHARVVPLPFYKKGTARAALL